MKTTITIAIDTHGLQHLEDSAVASFWHVAQINPAPFGDLDACGVAEALRTEIVRRWLASVAPPLHGHQAVHVEVQRRIEGVIEGGAA